MKFIRKSFFLASLAMLGTLILSACIIDLPPGEETTLYPTSSPVKLPSPYPTKTPTAAITAEHTPTESRPSGFVPGDPTSTPPGWDIEDPLFQEGQTAYWSGDYETVITAMDSVIRQSPTLAPAYWYRGMAYWYLDDCETGLTEMEAALSIDPAYALAWADRGLFHSCLGDDAAFLRDSTRALELDPSLAKVHERLGSHAYNAGDYPTALQEFDTALSIDPTRKWSWTYRSEIYQKYGNYAKCLEDSSQAISLDPELWRAHQDHGICALYLGDYEQAVADLERYVSMVTDDSTGWYDLGIAYRRVGDLAESVAAYNKALALNPDYYPAMINRGVVLIDLERYFEAVADFSHALTYGEIYLAYSGRADAYYELGMYENARKDYERAIALFPYESYPYCRLAPVYYELSRYEDAIGAVADAAAQDPSCGQDQRLLEIQARSHYALGEYLAAIDFMNLALGQGQYTMGFYYRGIAYQAAGQTSEATSDLKYFVSLARSQGIVREEIADAERRLIMLDAEPSTKPTPVALAYATPMTYSRSTPFTVSGQNSVLLKLSPEPSIPTIDFVITLTFHFSVNGEGQSTLDFSLWSPSSGGWAINQGNNKIAFGESVVPITIPDPYVSRTGEIYLSIRNYGSAPIEITEISAAIEARAVDGQIVQHGVIR